MYDRESGGGFATIAAAGFNLIDSGPNNLDGLDGTTMEGMVWVGDYANCSWEVSDATLKSYVQARVGDPRVGVWFISDEPDWTCPNVTQQHRDRVALIKSIDPKAKTLTVLDSNSAQASLDQLSKFKDTTDYVGLDPYVCHTNQPCAYNWIDRNAAAADALGINYWGVAQAFADPTVSGYQWLDAFGSQSGSLRLPTAPEIHEQFNRWRASKATGMLTFSWRWPRDNSLLWLQNHPELQDQLRIETGV